MEYKGKLYGKVGAKYFDTGKTSEDYDELLEALKECRMQLLLHSEINPKALKETGKAIDWAGSLLKKNNQ